MSVLEKRLALKPLRARFFLGDVHRRDERSPFGGEDRLSVLGISKLAAAVRVAASLDDLARRVDGVETVFGVRRERAAEGLQLRDDIVAALVGSVLKHAAFGVAIELDVPVVQAGEAPS